MPQQYVPAVENNFTKGLVTEFTGLNFPENAATEADNCEFTLVGNITRRLGIDYEINSPSHNLPIIGGAVAVYKWNNAGGDGLTQIIVQQLGGTLYFWRSSTATVDAPLSAQLLVSTINMPDHLAFGATFDGTIEATFADGNGYLFVYHPNCEPFYCSYTGGIVVGTSINIQIRDFVGLTENIAVNTRPSSLTPEHNYNLTNQGWTAGNAWATTSQSSVQPVPGPQTFSVPTGLPIAGGDQVAIFLINQPGFQFFPPPPGTPAMTGTVSSYSGGTLVVNVTSSYGGSFTDFAWTGWQINQLNQGHINTWVSEIGNFPSNADVWWYFKDNTDVFNPGATAANVTLGTSNAPQGHYIYNAFNINRSLASGIVVTTTTIPNRPKVGAWFQGRVWYAGVDAQQAPQLNAPYYTWTETIYFSQVVVTPADFGQCYQENDPTSESFFDLLPTDGGTIVIPGCGSIYKLFPISNGMLVFAANGVWFITGSQGIGFSANDYTITKLSQVRSISPYSFVNVNGLPYFWNQEGIYAVEPQQGGNLAVNPLTVGTILSFYNEIPYECILYARGDYDPINYIIQWVYRSTPDDGLADGSRYQFDKILNYNTYNKAFFPYTVDNTFNKINGIIYVASPGGLNSLTPALKYPASNPFGLSWATEFDDNFVDWGTAGGVNYVSTFTTGYRIKGQAQRRLQIPYIVTFSRGGVPGTSFYIQAVWDYATTGNSGKWSTRQQVNTYDPNFSVIARRHRLRGQGLSLQLKFTSVDGQLFDLMGWSSDELVNTGL